MNKFKLIRGRLGLTILDVSKATGIHYNTIQRLENNNTKPNARTYAVLKDYYDEMEERYLR